MAALAAAAALIFGLVLGARAQLNPLGRFGKCVDVPVDTDDCLPENKVWYLQYRTENPDHYVHTCQAQYEKTVGQYYRSLLYYYNKGKMVNNPQNIKYHKVSNGKYYRGITVDSLAVNVYMYVLKYDPVMKCRIVYYCTDNEKANPDIYNVNISTLDQVPCNLEEVYAEAVSTLKDFACKLDVPLMRVEQSVERCEPLKVKVV